MDNIVEASHRLCAALHENLIDPSEMVIYLPREQWWRLYNCLERKFPGLMVYDGRGAFPSSFKYMGITYRPK